MSILQFLVIIIVLCVGGLIGFWKSFIIASRIIDKTKQERDKFQNYFEMYDQWMCLRNKNIHLTEYFYKNDLKNIAIYGLGKAAQHLMKELEDSDIRVAYAIDKNTKVDNAGIEVYSINDTLPDADIIVVTPTFAFESILNILEQKKIKIVSLDDIIYELMP